MTDPESNREPPGALADLAQLHAALQALAADVHQATRAPGDPSRELLSLSWRITQFRQQVRDHPGDEIHRWLENLHQHVEAMLTPAFPLADEPHRHGCPTSSTIV